MFQPMQFAVRFKSAEIAASFKNTWEEGMTAEQSETLIVPDAERINLSIASVGAMSPGPARAQSPMSPVKPATSVFSFANVPSPFAATKSSQAGPVRVGGFVFGKCHRFASQFRLLCNTFRFLPCYPPSSCNETAFELKRSICLTLKSRGHRVLYRIAVCLSLS